MADVSWLSEYRGAAAAAPITHGQDALTMVGVYDAGFGTGFAPGFGGAGMEEQSWHESALCAETDPEAFFPEKGGSTREAKKICTGCQVRSECLEYALSNDERFGIWGGLSERERRRLRRRAS